MLCDLNLLPLLKSYHFFRFILENVEEQKIHAFIKSSFGPKTLSHEKKFTLFFKKKN